MREDLGPIVQKYIDAGDLTGWIWLSHLHGGSWRRLLRLSGTDLGRMMDARDRIYEEFRVRHADAVAELQSICPGHDDYIWIGIANSQGNPVVPIGPAVLAT